MKKLFYSLKNIAIVLFIFMLVSKNIFSQGSQIFTTSGNFMVPAGISSLTVEVIGAGGNGGINGGGGGGGGGYAKGIYNVTQMSNISVVVGVGGGGSSSGTTSFGGMIQATAGANGSWVNNPNIGGGGAGGVGIGGTIVNRTGGTGGGGYWTYYGGGGAGAAGPSSNGGNGGNTIAFTGICAITPGGSAGISGGSPAGNGGKGAGYVNSNCTTENPVADGVSYGGGGGGQNGSGWEPVGNGAGGYCMVTWGVPVFITPIANFAASTTNICQGSSINFSDLSTNYPTSWTWSFPGGTPSSSSSQNPTITYNSPGVYPVTLTSSNQGGTSSPVTITNYITVNSFPNVTVNSGSICNGQSFTMTPSGAVSYVYSSGSAIVSPSATTTYVVTGTNSAGCSSSATSLVTVNAAPTLSVNSGAICAGKTFTMVPSGATTYTYSSGSANVSPSSTTSYTVTGTSSAGCVGSAVSTVTVNAAPTLSVNSGAICAGKTFTMVPSGATTYTYSSGSATVMPSTTTSYTVTGANGLGCISMAVSTVTVNTLPTVSVNSGAICAGKTFTMVPAGAVSYTYSSGSSTVIPSTTTSYTVTGANGLGCTSTAVSTVTVNTLPTVSVNSGAICNGQSFVMSPTGATTYTYSSGTATVMPSTTTSYIVTGANGLGCTSMAVSMVTVNALPTVSVNSGAICNGQSFVMLPTGATTYTYSSSTATVMPTTTTTYTVTGANGLGCTSMAVSTVTVNALPSITVNDGTICNGQIFKMVPAGAVSYTYSSGSANVNPSSTTSYTVTGTSSAGCLGSAVSTVTVNALPIVNVNSGSICNGQSFVMVPTGAGSYTYSSGTATVTPSSTTSYTVSGTSALGCVGSAVSTVTVSQLPIITVNSGTICNGQSFVMSPSGATTYSYSSGTAVVTPTATSSYTVIGTSSQNCQSAPQTLTVMVLPNSTIVSQPSNQLVVSGSTAIFTVSASGGSTLQWQTNLGLGYQNLSNAGQYSGVNTLTLIVSNVSATNNNQTFRCVVGSGLCADTTNEVTLILSPVGIEELDILQDIELYPNPTSSHVYVKSSVKYTTLLIINSVGQTVLNKESSNVIDVSLLSTGIYFIKLYDEKGQLLKVSKFVKQ